MMKGDFDQARRHYEQALQIEEEHQPDKRLQKAVIIQSIGNIFTDKNDFETALERLSRAHGIFQAILPEKHHIISTCWSDIGFVYEKKGDFNTALYYYRKALEIDEYCLPIDRGATGSYFFEIYFPTEIIYLLRIYYLYQDFLAPSAASLPPSLPSPALELAPSSAVWMTCGIYSKMYRDFLINPDKSQKDKSR
jgi:tetratricopeptide (TPR) repeat protein